MFLKLFLRFLRIFQNFVSKSMILIMLNRYFSHKLEYKPKKDHFVVKTMCFKNGFCSLIFRKMDRVLLNVNPRWEAKFHEGILTNKTNKQTNVTYKTI